MIDHELIIVQMVEAPPEDDGLKRERNGRPSPDVDQPGILGGRDQDLAHGGREPVHEQKYGREQSPHTRRCTGVRQLIRSDGAKALSPGGEDHDRHLPPDTQWGDTVTGRCLIAARRCLVDAPLDDGTES